MTAVLAGRAAEAVSGAQDLLTRRLGAPVGLTDPVELGVGRTTVLRVRVMDGAFALPRTVIVKQVSDTMPDPRDTPARSAFLRASAESAFLRETASYLFANALPKAQRPGPDLLAHDVESRLLILTDLGEQDRLSRLLRTSDERVVANLLMAYAQALGRLHAATVGREADFAALLRRVGARHRIGDLAQQAQLALAELPGALHRTLGVSVPDSVTDAVGTAMHLFDGGRFRAFSPFDLCPENVIVNDDGVRFLDYEWGGYRDAMLDLSYAFVPYPRCLCDHRLGTDRAQAMIEAWRAEVVGAWPELADDHLLAVKVLQARLAWVWLSTHWLLSADDEQVADVRGHSLSIPRSTAMVERWSTLATEASRTGAVSLAAFALSVVEAFTIL
ncbi:phosphotransferase family protein [Skermania piniformis]|uniref:Kinase n=1 Tax=Skermania pinensis TaxID=39122 RepID=A0ABX8SC47_9ACTN|nr:kinase [Skermania piniformis]QXQ15444.1 kinase [Skermania piniformis]